MKDSTLKTFLRKGTIIQKNKEILLLGVGERSFSREPKEGFSPHFYFPDFFLKIGLPWVYHEEWFEISLEDFIKALISHIQLEHSPIKINWALDQELYFFDQLSHLEKQIEEGKLLKAVPYLFTYSSNKMDPKILLKSLLNGAHWVKKNQASLYGLWDEEEGILGVTPEILFKQDEPYGKIETMACAATFRTNEERGELSNKLIREHDLVVQGIIQSLESFGSVTQHKRMSVPFGKISHLVTSIDLKSNKSLNFVSLVEALHPTAALGAFPKEEGLCFLEDYETKIPRGRFGAPIGFLTSDTSKCLVAIRNIQWNRRGMKIGAGAGIVAGSDREEEMQEIKLKINSVKEIFEL